MDSRDVKIRLRQELKILRESVNHEECHRAAQKTAAFITQLPEWNDARVICLYASFNGELSTADLIAYVQNSPQKLILPRVGTEGQPELCEVRNINDLEISSLGIPEPKKDCPSIHPHEVDFFLVPGLGFDRAGNRLGHGSGFYDRLLAQASPTAFLLGYGYDFQIIPAIPHEPHDVRVHALATPSNIIHIRPAQ